MTQEVVPASSSAEDLAKTMRKLSLDSIVLWESSVERGQPSEVTVGNVEATVNFEPQFNDGDLIYFVRGRYVFENNENELIVAIEMSFLLTYSTPWQDSPSDGLVEAFAKSVMMQVVPFQREFLATMTNRLGLPPFFLPLIRERDVTLEKVSPGEEQ